MRKFISKSFLTYYKEEGERVPRFYLPVRWELSKGTLECWLFFLAPIAWFYYVLQNIIITIIKDSVAWLKLLEQKRNGFKTKKYL